MLQGWRQFAAILAAAAAHAAIAAVPGTSKAAAAAVRGGHCPAPRAHRHAWSRRGRTPADRMRKVQSPRAQPSTLHTRRGRGGVVQYGRSAGQAVELRLPQAPSETTTALHSSCRSSSCC
jgi:hypothetical protein